MADTTYDLADVERLAGVVDQHVTDLDAQDRRLLHEIFATAGAASASAEGDEVQGYSISWSGSGGDEPSALQGNSHPLFESFSWGLSHPGGKLYLNPQPLPPG